MTDNLAILIDARPLRTYPVGRPGFHGGTEGLVKVLAGGLAGKGHVVHVLTPDLTHEEMRGPTEWWWGPERGPQTADVVIAIHSLETIGDLSAPLLVMVPNGIDPPLHGRGDVVSTFATFSQTHTDLMCQLMGIQPERCVVTGLGVSLEDYPAKPQSSLTVPGRMLWGNDPTRGLWHLLDIFDRVKVAVPEASLHVTYDFDRQFALHRWHATALSELMWECKRRIEVTPGVESLGALSRADLLREQMESHVHVMPSDPQNVGSQIHGLLQMEMAAAGVPLVLSDIEAFPEVFGEAATILPLPGTQRKRVGDDMVRVDAQDWADEVVALMKSPKRWKAASKASRALAEQHDWSTVIERWDRLLSTLVAGMNERAEDTPAAA